MKEEWKDIKGFEGIYKISSKGRVKTNYTRRGIDFLKLNIKNGYCFVNLYKDNVQNGCYVHRLVAQAFIPNPNEKDQVNHKNGVKTDNRLCNLEWLTHTENVMHAFEYGLMRYRGEDHGSSKLKRNDVHQIRSIYSQGWFTQVEIADAYGVSDGAICMIINKKRWGHI